MVPTNDPASYFYFSLHIQETKNYLINDKLIDCYSAIEAPWPKQSSLFNVNHNSASILCLLGLSWGKGEGQKMSWWLCGENMIGLISGICYLCPRNVVIVVFNGRIPISLYLEWYYPAYNFPSLPTPFPPIFFLSIPWHIWLSWM